MKKIYSMLIVIAIFLFSTPSFAQDVPVRQSLRKDGSYVQPHRRTRPDNSKLNNYSTNGNINPYTGKKGTVDPYSPPKRKLNSIKPSTF